MDAGAAGLASCAVSLGGRASGRLRGRASARTVRACVWAGVRLGERASGRTCVWASSVGITAGVLLRAPQSRLDGSAPNHRCLGAKRSRQRDTSLQQASPSAATAELYRSGPCDSTTEKARSCRCLLALDGPRRDLLRVARSHVPSRAVVRAVRSCVPVVRAGRACRACVSGGRRAVVRAVRSCVSCGLRRYNSYSAASPPATTPRIHSDSTRFLAAFPWARAASYAGLSKHGDGVGRLQRGR